MDRPGGERIGARAGKKGALSSLLVSKPLAAQASSGMGAAPYTQPSSSLVHVLDGGLVAGLDPAAGAALLELVFRDRGVGIAVDHAVVDNIVDGLVLGEVLPSGDAMVQAT